MNSDRKLVYDKAIGHSRHPWGYLAAKRYWKSIRMQTSSFTLEITYGMLKGYMSYIRKIRFEVVCGNCDYVGGDIPIGKAA